MEIDQKLFLHVPLNTNEPNKCTPPDPGPDWRGIVIQAPLEVGFEKGNKVDELGAFAKIPICGYYQMDALSKPWKEPMRLFAVDKMTGKAYSGNLRDLDPSPVAEEPPEDKVPITPEEVAGYATGDYFNPNLADFVKLPEREAQYDVYVEFRGFKSNMVTIRMIEEKRK